jgi:AbrB family looped-hinge helix DNA binding protein
MLAKQSISEQFMGSVTVGERGQVVIPAEARERCSIEPGDKLLSFAHPAGVGVIFLKVSALSELSEELRRIMEGPLPVAGEAHSEEAQG